MFRDSKKLLDGANNTEKPKQKDDRFYNIKMNTEGKYAARIRFLPSSDKDDERLVTTFFVQSYSHTINKDNGQKYIHEFCPTTIGEVCPICEYNKEHWDSYITKDEKTRSRKTHWIANIYVVHDNNHPERDGKVYLWKFGKKIFEKIKFQISRRDDGVEKVEPYDITNIMTGKDFIIRAQNVKSDSGTFPNYDQSKFSDTPSSLCDGDKEKINAVAESLYGLEEFVMTKEKMKSFDEIKSRFLNFIGSKSEEDKGSHFDKENSGVSISVASNPVEGVKTNEERVDVKGTLETTKTPPTNSNSLPSDDFFD